MKTIKFFSFALIVALAWVSCKNTGAETTTETTGISADSLAILKTAKQEEINMILNALNEKITTTEAAIASASDDATSTALSTKLETYKSSVAGLQEALNQVNNASAATWDSLTTVITDQYTQAKMALAGTDTPASSTVGGTTENK